MDDKHEFMYKVECFDLFDMEAYLWTVSSNEIDQAVVVEFQHVDGHCNVELGRVFLDQLEYAMEGPKSQSGLCIVADDGVRLSASSLTVSAYAHVVAVEG